MTNIIFIANNNIGAGLSGGDTIFLQFLKQWSTDNTITVFGSQEAKNLINKNQIKKVTFIKTDNTNNNPSLSTINLLIHQIKRSFKGIKTLIKNKQIIKQSNYIYSVSDFYPDLLPALVAKLINPKIKWLAGFYLFAPNPFNKASPYNTNNQFLKGFIYYLFQKPTYFLTKKFANIVLVTSDPDTKKFPQKTIIVQGGVDLDEVKTIKKIPLNKRHYHAVFMGRLHPQKGVSELIDIWKLVTEKIPNAKLAIIGDGQLDKQIKSKINKLNLNKNIDMLGFLTGTKKYQIFANSKIVVHPATYDSGGMSAAQAMAFGLPLISYDLPALKTYYPTACLKTKCFDQKQFSKNIIKLLTDYHLHSKLSLQANKLIENNWNWQKRSQQIYNQIFNK
ncbi:MAG: putative poly(glycerol-phosphate) alpha-glucosyltransferase [Candidatus Dependentiae bacterium ADurb.Bin246]|nr:MAG: putative poly(glycerol-phosphate) alpha-glucosyltransferase [Candidatus Dependentiae bacterium ADurb.Bin246]